MHRQKKLFTLIIFIFPALSKLCENNFNTAHKKNLKTNYFLFNIRTRILFYFGLLFSIILTLILLVEIYGIPFTDFTGEYGQHRDIEFQNLNLIAELKKERLLRWIEERKDDVKVIANSSILNTYINRLILLRKKHV